VLFLNQADDERLASAGRRLADQLLPTYDAVMIARLATENENAQVLYVCEPIASVILAAGGSTRFGTPKLSLTWRGKSFIDNILDTISRCTFSQAVLVLNNAHSQLINITRPSNLITIINPNWQEGQASSIRLGVKSLPGEIGGVVFFLGDQPQIPERLVQELISRHACTHAAVIAPFVDGRRGNPVLFDRSTFKDLEQLQGDLGGRAIFAKYPVEYVPWHDASILLDVDTPEDYSRLLELE
jgi:molybdenum cofactor cytidylyltransferase